MSDQIVPPARVANQSGDGRPLDYDPGRRTSGVAPGEAVPTALPSSMPSLPDPGTVEAGSAQRMTEAMILRLKDWSSRMPHEIKGEAGVVIGFFRNLKARDVQRTVAVEHGQDVPDDKMQLLRHRPPHEFYELRQLAAEARNVLGLSFAQPLSDGQAAMVDQLRKHVDALLPPGQPVPVPPSADDDPEEPTPVQADPVISTDQSQPEGDPPNAPPAKDESQS